MWLEFRRVLFRSDSKSKVKTYDKFMEMMYDKKLDPIKIEYFKKLSKEGYNMIIDSSDRDNVADNPIIIFNGDKTLEYVKKKKTEYAF